MPVIEQKTTNKNKVDFDLNRLDKSKTTIFSKYPFIFGICQAAAGYAAWVFALAAPVRSFCKAAAGQIREADYILVHHQKDTYENAAEEMDRLLGVTHTSLRSIQCREGTYKETSKRKEMIV